MTKPKEKLTPNTTTNAPKNVQSDKQLKAKVCTPMAMPCASIRNKTSNPKKND